MTSKHIDEGTIDSVLNSGTDTPCETVWTRIKYNTLLGGTFGVMTDHVWKADFNVVESFNYLSLYQGTLLLGCNVLMSRISSRDMDPKRQTIDRLGAISATAYGLLVSYGAYEASQVLTPYLQTLVDSIM